MNGRSGGSGVGYLVDVLQAVQYLAHGQRVHGLRVAVRAPLHNAVEQDAQTLRAVHGLFADGRQHAKEEDPDTRLGRARKFDLRLVNLEVPDQVCLHEPVEHSLESLYFVTFF